jgi:hypothetical protein
MSARVSVAPEPRTPEERRQELVRRLDEVSARTALLDAEEKRIEGELAEIAQRLRPQRRLPMAKTVIASPCDVAWTSMHGDERMRFCKSCEKYVHNLSAMSAADVEAFLDRAAGTNTCVRLFERADGTILTEDCPVGVKRRRRRALLLTTLGIGACALFGFTSIAIAVSMTAALSKPERVPGPAITLRERVDVPVPVIVPAPASLPTPPAGAGWLLVDGPQHGVRVLEGNRLLGTTPLVTTLPSGVHSLRAEGTTDGTKWAENISVSVPAGGRAEANLTDHAKPKPHVKMGKMAPNIKGGFGALDF